MRRSTAASRTVPVAPVALDDPVPAGSSVSMVRPECVELQPHTIERAVRRRLSSQKGIRFLELVVRRMPDGVCLEGVMHTDGECPDVASVVREIAGVEQVINHLLVLRSAEREPETDGDLAASV